MIGFDAVGKRGTKPVRSPHFFDMNRQRPAVKRIKRVYRRPTDGGTDRLSFCVGCGSGSQRRHVTLGRSARDSDARFRSGRPAQALGLSCLTDGSWNINNIATLSSCQHARNSTWTTGTAFLHMRPISIKVTSRRPFCTAVPAESSSSCNSCSKFLFVSRRNGLGSIVLAVVAFVFQM